MIWAVTAILFFLCSSNLQAQENQPSEQKPAKPDPKMLNQLWKNLKNVLPAIPFQPEKAAEKAEASQSGSHRMKLDPHAPVDAQQAVLWRKTVRQIQLQNWKQALELMQFILELPEDGVIQSQDRKLVPIRLEAQKLIRLLPREHQDHLRIQYEGFSQQKLEEAQEAGELLKFYEIASRFLFTPAGQEAANYVGMYYFDRGRFGLATYWFDWLQVVESRLTQRATWKMKAALAYSAAGKQQRFQQIMEQIQQQEPERFEELKQSLQKWETQLKQQNTSSVAESEWMLALGNPSRNGIAQGGDPLLKARWNIPVTFNLQLKKHMERSIEEFAEGSAPQFMSQFPLMVQGVAIFKTLKGLAVIDVETGKLQWETSDPLSPEVLLTRNAIGGTKFDSTFAAGGFGVQAWNRGRRRNFRGARSIESFPFPRLLFSNFTYGSLSSDGARVFVLEAQSLDNSDQYQDWRRRNRRLNDHMTRLLSSNKLVAYDLKTGRPLWQVGGVDLFETFGLPLSGYYFHGTPVLDQDELLVVAEKEDELLLLSLDPATGVENWSRQIAYADSKIARDSLRRHWGNQVAASEGVLVCPTGSGWLVAIDRMTHSILWAQQYRSKSKNNEDEIFTRNRFQHVDPEMVGEQFALPPVISQNHVLYAPPEEDFLCCYDLQSGRKLWKKTPSTGLYFAGVFQGQALVIEENRLVAYDLNTGHLKWKCLYRNYDSEAGLPSGVGVATTENYYLPFNSGQLWSIDLETGNRSSVIYLTEDSAPLGNLTMYHGKLFSLNSGGLTCFEQRAFVEEKIASRLETNSEDPWALIRKAEIAILSRDFEAAFQSLKRIDQTALSLESVGEYRKQLRTVLQVCSQEPSELLGVEALDWGIDQLKELSRKDSGEQPELLKQRQDEWLLISRVQISRSMLEKDYENAMRICLEIIPQILAEPNRMVHLNDRWKTDLRIDVWLAGQIHSLWEQADDSIKETLKEEIDKFLVHVDFESLRSVQLASRLFEFHPSALEFRQQLATSYEQSGDWLLAEQIWSELLNHSDSEIRQQAAQALAAMLESKGLAGDAELLSKNASNPQASESEQVEEKNSASPMLQLISKYDQSQPWPLDHLQFQTESLGYLNQQEFDSSRYFPEADRLYFRQRHARMLTNLRLAISSNYQEEIEWLVSLRGEMTGQTPRLFTSQHVLVVPSGNFVHALSPVDRRVLWTRELDVDPYADSGYYTEDSEQGVMMKERAALRSSRLVERWDMHPSVAFVDGDSTAVIERRRLLVLDTITGQVRWSFSRLPREARILGNQDYLILFSETAAGEEYLVFSTRDGSPINVDQKTVLSTLHQTGSLFVTVSYEKRMSPKKGAEKSAKRTYVNVIQSVHPETLEVGWQHEFSSKTRLGKINNQHVLALSPEGELSELDLQTGKLFSYDQLDPQLFKSFRQFRAVVAGQDLILIGSKRGWADDSNGYVIGSLTSLPVNGRLICLDRLTGKLNWSEEILNQNLILDSLEQAPFLTLINGKYLNEAIDELQQLEFQARDRATGKLLLQHDFYMADYLESLRFDHQARSVRLGSSTQRFLITADPVIEE